MKKRINIAFFSSCFLAALLAELYCIQSRDMFSIVGIGFVVLITGYLLLDTIRSQWAQSSEKVKLVLERSYQEETEKWNERYTELINLQKATYTATKKNMAMLQEQWEESQIKIDTVDKSNEKALKKIIDLQKKAMEGQKNALNLEINYNKENTKQLMKVLRDESNKIEQSEQLNKIITLLEKNNIIMEEYNKLLKEGNIKVANNKSVSISEENLLYEQPMIDINEIENEDTLNKIEQPTIVPLYDDPNKALTPDEIANMFASYGK